MAKKNVDLQIVVFLFYLSALIYLTVFIVVVLGFANFPDDFIYPVIIGLVKITSNLGLCIHSLFFAIVLFGLGWGLLKRNTYAWLMAVLFEILNVVDSFFAWKKFPISATISIGFCILIICWLFLRRKLFVDKKTEIRGHHTNLLT